MVNLRTRSEYSFGIAFGSYEKAIAAARYSPDVERVGFCDRASTWGHVQLVKAAAKSGLKSAILGVEIAVVPSLTNEANRYLNYAGFLARNDAGLQELYGLVTRATAEDHFYYVPRLTYADLAATSENVVVMAGSNPVWESLQPRPNLFIDLGPNCDPRRALDFAKTHKRPFVAVSDNYFPRPEDRAAYEIVTGRRRDARTTAMHILDPWEWHKVCLSSLTDHQAVEAIARTNEVARSCDARVPKAEMVKYPGKLSLAPLCRSLAKQRGVDLENPVYAARFKREIELIVEKDFTDYFLVIWDLIAYAKQHMLVGPGRGSSGGSLVCYILGITEIDPIRHGLLFERFIDVNRADLPDIDIDFPDDRRDLVFAYAENKYGSDCVARLGTVMRYQAKSALDIVSKALKIPGNDIEQIKSVLIERTIGDAERGRCLRDTLDTVPEAKEVLEKYPHLAIASEVEDHTSTTGQHAAGIVITNRPVSEFCSVMSRLGVTQLDKYDAEEQGLLKIDALGLRTLSVIQDCLDQIGKDRDWLVSQPLDDAGAYRILNNGQMVGVFQFEGSALRNLCSQMTVERFEDISALSALARPGPLNSGAAGEYIRRKTGQTKVVYYHPSVETLTKETFGLIVYQEQVMQIAREMGQMSWEKVSKLRKAIAKSQGDEAVAVFKEAFVEGATKLGVRPEVIESVWDSIKTMGAYSFNKSHAVAYGVISYWCSLLKSRYPLQFAVACLRHAADNDQIIALLRELDTEGIKYSPYDAQLSTLNWSIHEGRIIGGLTNIIGIGEKKAAEILEKRAAGAKLTPGLAKKLEEGKTPFDLDVIFGVRHEAGPIIAEPVKYGIVTPITALKDITSQTPGEWLFWGRVMTSEVRDLNSDFYVQRRGYQIPAGRPHLFLALTVQDDTASIPILIGKDEFAQMGREIVATLPKGSLALWKGTVKAGTRKVYINRFLTMPQIWKRAQ